MSSSTTKHDEEREVREAEVSIARLPVTGRDLFGRAADLAWLDACWRERAHVASVVAWGGVGKSALVNAWLARVRDEGWRGAQRVFGWSFYSQGTERLGSSDEFFAAALRLFGEDGAAPTSPWEKGERLAALVRRKRALLILDGVEPLQWGPGVQAGRFKDPALEALVKELGAQNRGLCLITSRIGVTDLDGLGGDKVRAKDLGHLSPEAGAELLKARGAKGADEELRAAAEEYDGHSFALTLLGTYVRKAHKGDIRQREDIPPLEGEPAHRMMATYERWFADKPELAILRMLGLFDRPAPADEIAAVRAKPLIDGLTDKLDGVTGGAWNEAVTTLRDVGLLADGAEDDDRLDAHPLVREHFGEQLRPEKPEAWREGHRRLYEHLRANAKPLPETIEEMTPLYAAVVHGCLSGKSQEALVEVWVKRVYRQGEAFNSSKLGAVGSEVAVYSAFFDPPWERLAPGLTEPWPAWVVNEAGFSLRALGRLAEAAGLLRRGLELRFAQENWKEAAKSASNLSAILQSRGELYEATALARKSVELADKSGEVWWRMVNRSTLAVALHTMGFREEAAAQFEEAERMQKEQQPAYPLLYTLAGFRYCDLLLDQGRDAEVRERAAQTLEWAREHLDIALDHLSLGRAHLLVAQHGAAGDLTVATSHLTQAVAGIRRAARQDFLPRGLLARAALHTHTGAFDLARRDLAEAHTLATRCGLRLRLADAHLGLARLSLAEGHPALPDARADLAAARRIIAETGYHRRDGELAELDAEAAEMAKTAAHASPPPASPAHHPPPPHPTEVAMPLLDDTEIRQIHAAAISAGLITHRGALMVGIDDRLVAGLPDATSPAAQMMRDLDALAKAGALADGTIPLRIWLANAAHFAGPRVEAALFARFRDRLPASGPSVSAPDAAEPHREAMTPAQLLDVLVTLLPAQLDMLVFKLAVPVAFLSGANAAPATRCIEVLRWAEQADRLADVARALAEVAGKRTR